MLQTERSFDYVKINLASPSRIRSWGERILPNGEIVGEEVILSGDIGRIRDFEIDQEGDIYLITDLRKSPVWKLTR